MNYIIKDKHKNVRIKGFANAEDARHWIINHLDMSNGPFSIDQMPQTLEETLQGQTIKGNLNGQIICEQWVNVNNAFTIANFFINQAEQRFSTTCEKIIEKYEAFNKIKPVDLWYPGFHEAIEELKTRMKK